MRSWKASGALATLGTSRMGSAVAMLLARWCIGGDTRPGLAAEMDERSALVRMFSAKLKPSVNEKQQLANARN